MKSGSAVCLSCGDAVLVAERVTFSSNVAVGVSSRLGTSIVDVVCCDMH